MIVSTILSFLIIPALKQPGDTYQAKIGVQARIIKNKIKSNIYKSGLNENWENTRNSFYIKHPSDTIVITIE